MICLIMIQISVGLFLHKIIVIFPEDSYFLLKLPNGLIEAYNLLSVRLLPFQHFLFEILHQLLFDRSITPQHRHLPFPNQYLILIKQLPIQFLILLLVLPQSLLIFDNPLVLLNQTTPQRLILNNQTIVSILQFPQSFLILVDHRIPIVFLLPFTRT